MFCLVLFQPFPKLFLVLRNFWNFLKCRVWFWKIRVQFDIFALMCSNNIFGNRGAGRMNAVGLKKILVMGKKIMGKYIYSTLCSSPLQLQSAAAIKHGIFPLLFCSFSLFLWFESNWTPTSPRRSKLSIGFISICGIYRCFGPSLRRWVWLCEPTYTLLSRGIAPRFTRGKKWFFKSWTLKKMWWKIFLTCRAFKLVSFKPIWHVDCKNVCGILCLSWEELVHPIISSAPIVALRTRLSVLLSQLVYNVLQILSSLLCK